MSPAPDSFAAVIDLLRERSLLGEIGIKPSHARTMRARGRIPAVWHPLIMRTAKRHRLPISRELLDHLAAIRTGAGAAV